MKKIAIIALAAFSSSLLFVSTQANAGETYKSFKEPKTIIEVDEPCFAENELTLDVFAAYQGNDGSGFYDDGWGGGVGINYFFAKYFGIGVEGFWNEASTEGSVLHHVNGLVYVRVPIDSICIAPYALGGGGIIADSENNGDIFVGGGIEWRFKPSVSLFGDGRYTWTDENDFAVARMGLRFAF